MINITFFKFCIGQWMNNPFEQSIWANWCSFDAKYRSVPNIFQFIYSHTYNIYDLCAFMYMGIRQISPSQHRSISIHAIQRLLKPYWDEGGVLLNLNAIFRKIGNPKKMGCTCWKWKINLFMEIFHFNNSLPQHSFFPGN